MRTQLFIFIGCLLTFSGTAQDVGFSQLYDQPLLRNPALAGIFAGDVRFTASYRNQWQSVTIPYRTFGLSSEFRLPVNVVPDDNITLGLQLFKDIAGTSEFSAVQILPAVNYSLPMSEETNSYLSLGLMSGLRQQQFDPAKLILNDQFVALSNGSFSILPASRQVFDHTSVNYFDLSVGLSYTGIWNDAIDYYIGAALFHINKPQVGFFQGSTILLNRKLAFNAGFSLPVSETDQFIIHGDYFKQYDDQFKPAGKSTLQLGVLYSHDWYLVDDDRSAFTLGMLYRMNDAVVPVIKLELSRFVIGLSYDVNISQLVVASGYRGGFELTVSFRDFLNGLANDRRVRYPGSGSSTIRDHFIGY
ncbi:MAG TPA: PorP/SprF family type IX secretion system membrane protein [Chitinophagaceae bacterium]|nr:PorP/SprF family type IX secretion system membrane protein [Chitinophagaceae bacterium]